MRRAACLAALLLAACAEEQSRFPVVITTVTDDGKPLSDVPVNLGASPAGVTGADGRLQVRVAGKEGQRVPVSVVLPKGYQLTPGTPPAIVLRRLADIEGSGNRALPVEHTIKLSPLARQYAVLVRVGVPNLPVETFGTRQAVTNEKGVALFLYTGAPGDELQVRVSTEARPDLRPQNPTVSFLLAQRSEAYVVRQTFSVERPRPVHRKPKHVGPKRL